MELASLSLPPLHIVCQQVPDHRTMHLAVNVMPGLAWSCKKYALLRQTNAVWKTCAVPQDPNLEISIIQCGKPSPAKNPLCAQQCIFQELTIFPIQATGVFW